ncbi:hypothetical protein BSNK01_14730 [Bacillaceae bacterium]
MGNSKKLMPEVLRRSSHSRDSQDLGQIHTVKKEVKEKKERKEESFLLRYKPVQYYY